MTVLPKGNSGAIPVTSTGEVCQLVVAVRDHTVVNILAAQPAVQDIEAAAMIARQEGERIDLLGHGFSGTAAHVHVYDILSKDAIYSAVEERGPSSERSV